MNSKLLKKAWHFIWDDNSIWSWLANIILAFVLIKFIVYPGLGFVFGTNFPIVAVVSGSMEHGGAFEQWWNGPCCFDQKCTIKKTQTEIYNKWRINKEKYTSFPFTSGFNKGDIMILVGPKNLKQGDVLVFMAQGRIDPIIHRLVDIRTTNIQTVYNTQGDNNCGAIADFEKNISEEKLLGKAYLKIPLLGWLKIWFVQLITMMGLV